jgi:hypothetical protein
MDFTRSKAARTLATIALFLMLAHPARAAGLRDALSPIETIVAALESALGNILAFIAPHAAPTITIAPAAQRASGTPLSAAAVNAATASSAPPLATTPPPPPAQPQPLADAAIPATQPPALPSPPAAPIPAPQATEALASLSPAIDTNYVTQQQLVATIAQLQSSINNQLYSSTSTYAYGGIWNAIAATNRIDNLSGSANGPLTISDATLSNVSGLSTSDISGISGIFSISQGGLGTSTAPGANELLFSDANGNWEYVATSSLGISAGGGATPAGSNDAVQFNNAGALGADTNNFSYTSSTAAPSAPTVTTHGTPGSTHYGYEVVFRLPTGASAASPEALLTTGNATLSSSNYNIITPPACPSVPNVSVDIYASTPGPGGYEGLLANIPCGTSYDDQNDNGEGRPPPTSDTSNGLFAKSLAIGNSDFSQLNGGTQTKSLLILC